METSKLETPNPFSGLHALWPPVPGHPIQTALREALHEKFRRLAESSAELTARKPQTDEQAVGLLQRFAEVSAGINELLGWICRSHAPMSPAQADQWAEMLFRDGWSASEVREFTADLRRKRRGRPVTKRHIAIEALELRLSNPEWFWSRVTRRVCNCGQPEHGRECQERLRQQVNDLRDLFKRYGIQEPPRRRSG